MAPDYAERPDTGAQLLHGGWQRASSGNIAMSGAGMPVLDQPPRLGFRVLRWCYALVCFLAGGYMPIVFDSLKELRLLINDVNEER